VTELPQDSLAAAHFLKRNILHNWAYMSEQ